MPDSEDLAPLPIPGVAVVAVVRVLNPAEVPGGVQPATLNASSEKERALIFCGLPPLPSSQGSFGRTSYTSSWPTISGNGLSDGTLIATGLLAVPILTSIFFWVHSTEQLISVSSEDTGIRQAGEKMVSSGMMYTGVLEKVHTHLHSTL